ncbi:arad-like aldolase/epimerase [Didymella exigua CBS 183.55]|uniref:Arad-like aldolase/epimerase n=1 Tax=Didymella exigua CBS 183.55 TaxID=1150837 RepID=A0A6A5RAQ2_9PLEO|nr:arad-like aldolase/epimerase [Didymella exigua CBS 183.55]KAF1922897.1 arad-like aldolase/epimerase [Didymella exigua CBS 183.55]
MSEDTKSRQALLRTFVTCNHILHKNGILDAYGHISVRNPENPNTFFMSRNMPPALVSSADDVVEYQIEDAEPIAKNAPRGFIERYIHSEIMKRFSGVNVVVHAHTPDILPFTIAPVPLRPAIHMAGFLGTHVPVWDIADAYCSGDKPDLLVRNASLGQAFAAAYPATDASGAQSRESVARDVPTQPLVLMRGHGFTACAESLETALFYAIYTLNAARVQTSALALRSAQLLQGNDQTASETKAEAVVFLSEAEAQHTWAMNKGTMARPWALWSREVEVDPLYRNDV